MKKRWIPFMLCFMAVAFMAGQFFGASAQVEHQEARVETQAIMETTIAVINADIGSYVDGERQNFSAAIIDTLDENFVLVSPAMAYTGLSLGIYGAVITFPSHVSERVLSFNTHNPEQVRLEFQINPNLPEQDFIETHTRIMDLQMAINTSIAYTYVSSIFEQFHAAQDEVERIFLNDQAQLEALDDVTMEQFTASLQLDRLPDLPLSPNAPVTSHFMTSVTDFAELVMGIYQGSFDSAVEDYLYMREGLVAMTEHFPEQEREWMQALDVWSDIFTDYGDSLQAYSDLVRRHQLELEDWYMRASFWSEDLAWYQENLEEWFGDIDNWNNYLLDHEQNSFEWFMFAMGWQDDLTMYQMELDFWHGDASFWHDQLLAHDNAAMDWLDEAAAWHEESAEHKADMTDWYDSLHLWNDEAMDWRLDNIDYMDAVEIFRLDFLYDFTAITDEYNDIVADLEDWADELMTDIMPDIMDFIAEYNDFVDQIDLLLTALADWYIALDAYVAGLHTQIDDMNTQIIDMDVYIADMNTQIAHISTQLGSMNSQIIVMQSTVGSIAPLAPFVFIYNDHGSQLTQHNQAEFLRQNLENTINSFAVTIDGFVITGNDFVSIGNDFTGIGNDFMTKGNDFVTTAADWAIFLPELDPNFTLHPDPNDPSITVIDTLRPTPWTGTIPPIPNIDNLNFDKDDFDDLGIILPDPVDNPPVYEGMLLPAIVTEPPLLEADQTEEPPALDTDEPDNPPQITELPPMAAIQPTIQQPGDPTRLETYQPNDPRAGRPPRADDFWDSLNDMQGQLMRFDVGNYLTSAYRWEVNRMLSDYGRYLDFVRSDLASQFDDNVDMLMGVRFGYTDFLSELRTAALQAEAETIDQLDNTLNVFAQRVEEVSEDTRYRLEGFAGMMPESRTPMGPNRNLTRFAVAPFDIVTPQLREAAAHMPTIEVQAETIVPTFEGHLWIAIAVLGAVLALTLGSYVVTWHRKRDESE